jgi:hypothetical protein
VTGIARGGGQEAEEIRTEAELIDRKGGGGGESTPVRRLAFVVATALLVFVALWYSSH